MIVSVADAARALGVSERRVLAMLHSGELKGEKVGGRWVVSPHSLRQPKPAGRPMSPRNAWALILKTDSWLDAQAAWKLNDRMSHLRDRSDPALVLASWLRSRGERLEMSAPDPAKVLDDIRVVPSGVSDRRSQMAVSDLVEGYVHQDEAEAIKADHWLVPSRGKPNAILHVSPFLPPNPVPIALVIADLVDNGSERDVRQARELAREYL
ncbi:helix-turn-helix domain-containing protein [Cellulosimicrobium sp. Marseille-Q4280]|jgi:excisionase family DNA binding protein|uniref:helix-turn-helix domain-containing protein n=1 Tax=Cellulosimicrobium sp. Marseille-Q4280 TaxID=2937992 RepID=UPI00203BD42A|nr:helix-turn-helix domain-containing protein [Cellulosimicrobium sp. Marseille-Q4280]